MSVNGTLATFTNGQDTLHFSPSLLIAHPNTFYRIGGQIEGSSYSNGLYPVNILITTITGGLGITWVDSSHHLSVNNTWSAGYPRGWTPRDYSQIYYVSDL